MSGGKLTDLLLNTHFTEPEIAAVCKECLEALKYCHDNSKIHRDIKSDNLLIGSNGIVKLADFGFCAELNGPNDKRRSVVGTPYWSMFFCFILLIHKYSGPRSDSWCRL